MASISYDSSGLHLDGRRIWLVSGTLHYTRIPRGLWAERIRAARQAGLNCIETAVVWSVHEPQPDVFRFDADADLKHFVQLVADQGMYLILRIGPFVGDGFDMGGLPPWLLDRGAHMLRQADPAYLQNVARYLDAVMAQVAKHQATEAKPGPIVLVQNEHEWFCHNDEQGEEYLQQISRFLREAGCKVPLINRNNLYQQVAGTIDTWSGDGHLLANCRQLRAMQTDAPCIVTSLPAGSTGRWASAPAPAPDDDLLDRMTQAAAAGAMFNLDPFCGGTNLAFLAGRLASGDLAFVTTNHDPAAPLTETGLRTDKYAKVKRLATFLTQFEHLIAAAEPSDPHTVAATGVAVVQRSGSLGRVVFILRHDRSPAVELTTPDGQSLVVHFGKDAVAWLLLNANLQGAAKLDLTNLRPFAFLGRKLLVLFGPAGSEGLVSINGALVSVDVPAGSEPTVLQIEDVVVAILNDKQVDAAYIQNDTLHVGAAGLSATGEPLDHPAFATRFVIAPDGSVTRKRRGNSVSHPAPLLSDWRIADASTYTAGKAPRFATLDGPKSLESCGADFGYGWYRIRISRSRAKSVKLIAPHAADRLHLYREGKLLHILGVGPGASDAPVPVDLPAGDCDFIILADNLGRFSEDLLLNRPAGLFGHLLAVAPVRLPKPKPSSEPRIDPFQLTAYVPRCSADDHGPMPRYTFDIKLAAKAPHLLTLTGDRPRSVILVNHKPVAIDVGLNITAHHLLHDDLRKGPNKITFALIDEPPAASPGFDPSSVAKLHRVEETLTEGAQFWYARWQMPDDHAYTNLASSTPNGPAFFRSTFTVKSADAPLVLDLAGASKGQLYLNGRNLGRYFVATASGKKVEGQSRYYLPEPYLNLTGPNDLVLFDEHGKPPAKSTLAYDA